MSSQDLLDTVYGLLEANDILRPPTADATPTLVIGHQAAYLLLYALINLCKGTDFGSILVTRGMPGLVGTPVLGCTLEISYAAEMVDDVRFEWRQHSLT